jgi:hypothetical protein
MYDKLIKSKRSLRRLLGIEQVQLVVIVAQLEPIWQAYLYRTYQRPGRSYKHSLGSMVVMLLIYYRSYITQDFLGYLFQLDSSNVCRIIKRIEPLLAQILPLPKRKVLSKEELETLILDVTEQPIERPKKGQLSYYSGKKKQHTLKTELRIDSNGQIVQLSKAYPGKTHDFAIFQKAASPPPNTLLLADSGYQGLSKQHAMALTPYKSSKHQPLCKHKKVFNQSLSSDRTKIEHTIRSVKIFKIIGNRYRNKRKRYELKFKLVTGLVNLNNGALLRERAA